jgi:hypothetical protein
MKWVLLVWFCSQFEGGQCGYVPSAQRPFESEQLCLDYVQGLGDALGSVPKCEVL